MFYKKILLLEIDEMRFSLAVGKMGYKERKIEHYELFQHSIQEGLLVDEKVFLQTIKDFVKTHELQKHTTRIVLKSNKILFRLATLPTLKKRDLEQAAQNSIAKFFPIDTDQYLIDYNVLGVSAEQTTLMYVGVPIYFNIYVEVVHKLKLKVTIVDAFQNCLVRRLNYSDYILILSLLNKLNFITVEENQIRDIREFALNDDIILETNRLFSLKKLNKTRILLDKKLDWLALHFSERQYTIEWLSDKPLSLEGLLIRKES